MCGASFPDAISSRFSQPKLGPAAPDTVLVATRPCSAGHSTRRAAPEESDSTIVSVWRCRKSRSAPKLEAGPFTAGPVYHACTLCLNMGTRAILLSAR